jgi:hypothetical protein
MMSRLDRIIHHWEKHTRVHFVVSAGFLIGSTLVMLYPELSTHALLINTMTNMLWLWEDEI